MFLDKVKQIQRAQSRPEGPPTRSRGPKGPKNSKIPHFQLVLTKFLSEPVPLWEWILKPAVVNIDFIYRIGMFGHFTAPSLCMFEVYIIFFKCTIYFLDIRHYYLENNGLNIFFQIIVLPWSIFILLYFNVTFSILLIPFRFSTCWLVFYWRQQRTGILQRCVIKGQRWYESG